MVILKTIHQTFTLECKQPSALLSFEHYEEIIFMDCSHMGWDLLPSPLPENLQILICKDNFITVIPNLPKNLRNLHASYNKIVSLPDITELDELETVDLSHNNVYIVHDVILPVNLKELNLKYNVLTKFSVSKWSDHLVELNLSKNRLAEIDVCFDNLISTCNVNLQYNDFPSQKYNAYTVWMTNDNANNVLKMVQRYGRFGIQLKLRTENVFRNDLVTIGVNIEQNNDHGIYNRNLQHIMDQILNLDTRPLLKSIYQDEHNVHSSSIQKSTNESLTWLINSDSIDPNAVVLIQHLWRPKHWWNLREWIYVFYANNLIEKWCTDMTIHSVHGITYDQLIGYIWNVIKNHPDKKEIGIVLRQEILDGNGVCFTGRFTRTLNALSGFIPQVQINISSREQMQNRIVQVLKETREKHDDGTREYEEEARNQITTILNEFSIPTDEQSAWLDAI
jgi:hypothetical protein